jgi:2-hydroxy-6-oxonona-2,4-dienedioate hydrolase
VCRYDRVGGLRVHARVSAGSVPAGAPTVVLVHGVLVSSRYMVPTAERLAPHARVYAPDLPGYGESDKPARALDVPALADALAAWMRAVGLGRADLVGNSFGCQILADFAARYPARVRRLVLLGPTVDPRARSPARLAARWLLNVPREPLALDLVVARDFLDMGPRRTIGTIRQMLRDRIEAKLPLVRAPTLVVRGARDTIVPRRWAEAATRSLPRGRLATIPGAGHTVNYNAPGAVARLVLAFLAEQQEAAGHEVGDRRDPDGMSALGTPCSA